MTNLNISPLERRLLLNGIRMLNKEVQEMTPAEVEAAGRTTGEHLFLSNRIIVLANRLEALQFNFKVCPSCGFEFDATNDLQTTCSSKCRTAMSRAKKAASGDQQ